MLALDVNNLRIPARGGPSPHVLLCRTGNVPSPRTFTLQHGLHLRAHRVLPATFRSMKNSLLPASLRRHRRGMTLLEVIIAIVLLGIVSGVLIASFGSTTDTSNDRALALRLNTAKVAAREVAALENYRYPSDTLDQIRSSGLTFQAAPSSDKDTVSFHQVDNTTIVMALRDGDTCVALIDSVVAKARWAMDLDNVTCAASTVALKDSSTWSSEQLTPTDTDLG